MAGIAGRVGRNMRTGLALCRKAVACGVADRALGRRAAESALYMAAIAAGLTMRAGQCKSCLEVIEFERAWRLVRCIRHGKSDE